MNATDARNHALDTAAQFVLDVRAKFPDASLADLHDPLSMPPTLFKAHRGPDRAAGEAYGASRGKHR